MATHPFRRASVRYGDTPDPVTPYHKAAQVWDERLGSARLQARNWRLAALTMIALAIVLTALLAVMVSRSGVIPYVVEVDRLGEVRAAGPAPDIYHPSDAQIAHFLARFVENVRSLSIDPVVVRANWLRAYDYVTDRGAQTLNEYAREADPFGKIGAKTATVEVISVVRASGRLLRDSLEGKHLRERRGRQGRALHRRRHHRPQAPDHTREPCAGTPSASMSIPSTGRATSSETPNEFVHCKKRCRLGRRHCRFLVSRVRNTAGSGSPVRRSRLRAGNP